MELPSMCLAAIIRTWWGRIQWCTSREWSAREHRAAFSSLGVMSFAQLEVGTIRGANGVVILLDFNSPADRNSSPKELECCSTCLRSSWQHQPPRWCNVFSACFCSPQVARKERVYNIYIIYYIYIHMCVCIIVICLHTYKVVGS